MKRRRALHKSRPDHRRAYRRLAVLSALVLAVTLAVSVLDRHDGRSDAQDAPAAGPPRKGYFDTLPAGSWSKLPDDATCAALVHRSPWEPRPSNYDANHFMPNPARVHASLKARPRPGVAPRWNSWMLARVTGHHTGTTDENIQWAACKWGISDNLLRAMAATESSWFQYLTDPTSGACVKELGCGDLFDETTAGSRTYCRAVGRHGYNYSRDFGPGRCPKTFSIAGVMSWQDPSWGQMPDDQNGTFPFNRDSTAFALDYLAGDLRGCMEGWLSWLADTGTRDYRPGNLWGCVGAWYAGAWQVPAARHYEGLVRHQLDGRVWLTKRWADERSFIPG